MLDLTVIVLTYNEELHIRRCLENVCPVTKKVFVVDSPSTDKTQEICNEFENVEVVVHKYPGNQAEQFNWALDNLQIDTEWVLRLDADEYLLPELVEELKTKVPTLSQDVTGIEFKRRHIFMGRWVKHGIYPVILLRMFRNSHGRYDNRLMDEHIVLNEGRSVVFDNDFCDHSLINISDYCRKHINYAQREASEILNETYDLKIDSSYGLRVTGGQADAKHKKKSTYNKLPLFLRSFIYFCYRYILKGGFIDGKEGFLFAFIQGWWYRTLVDAKVYEAKKWLKAKAKANSQSQSFMSSGNLTPEGKEALKAYIKTNWNITL